MSASEEKKNFLGRDWEKIPEERRPWVAPLLALAVSLVVVMLWALVKSLVEPGESFGGALAAVETQTLIIVWLAMLTVGFTIWRGQQTDDQIDETKAQVQEAQRQVREQGFSIAINMATERENEARVRAGFTRLSHLFGESKSEEEREYLAAAQGAAKTMLERGKKGRKGSGWGVRESALIFLTKNPPGEWEKNREWQLSNFDLSDLDLGELLNEAVERDATEKGWRVVACDSNCKRMKARGLNLSNSDFTKADLTGADLTGANLWNVTFSLNAVDGADFRQTKIVNPATGEESDLPFALIKGRCYWGIIDEDGRDPGDAPGLPDHINPEGLDDHNALGAALSFHAELEAGEYE